MTGATESTWTGGVLRQVGLPTLADTFCWLTPADRLRLAAVDRQQSDILAALAAQPPDEIEVPMFADLQVERLHVYREVFARHAVQRGR
ncbi:hypothetical protein [Isoptericola sp. NPDC055881]